MSQEKRYWKSEIELKPNNGLDEIRNNEFVDKLPVDENIFSNDSVNNSETNRRDFLKYLGFSTTAAVLASCEGPVNRSVPYVVQPDRIIPGISNYYATTLFDGYDSANVLVKTREGRPIKIDNNKLSSYNGYANARLNASVLSLYDSGRVQGPTINKEDVSWNNFNKNIKAQLNSLKSLNQQVVLLTSTVNSPTSKKIISEFLNEYPNVEHIEYDSISESSVLDAHELMYGTRALPYYDFQNAKCIVSIGADFLGDWQGSNYDHDYVKGRIPNKENGKASMSKHIQVESNLSITGSNADLRIPISVDDQKLFLAYLYQKVSDSSISLKSVPEKLAKKIDYVYDQLLLSPSKSVVLCGLDDLNAHIITNRINELLKSNVKSTSKVSLVRNGSDSKMNNFLTRINKGEIKGLIMNGVNPCYTLSNSNAFSEALKKLNFSVSFSMKIDETANFCSHLAATPHQLESWGDFEFINGEFSLTQPTIKPLFDTKQLEDCLLNWLDSENSFYDRIKDNWKNNILDSSTYWNSSLHDGVYSSKVKKRLVDKKSNSNLTNLNYSKYASELSSSKSEGYDLILYSKIGMGDGQQANNPWLQEFPDPLTRVSWDNYITVSKFDADEIGLKNYNESNGALNSNFAQINLDNTVIKAPVIIQPGQARGTLGLAFGYGRSDGVKEEMRTGVNAFKIYKGFSKHQKVKISSVYEIHEFACVQLHNTLMGRGDIIKETTLEIFNSKDKEFWNPIPKVSKNHIETAVNSREVDIWNEFDRSIGHHFNLSIDLNACTGCGACVIACHAENNVPVVGKEEVRKSRDMHWLRIDRYYSSESEFSSDIEKKENISGLGESLSVFGEMEEPSENPQVVFQPVMCQHCNHAPCETVCPVAASAHGRQGQNHMTYNRCVGTRYCANNCPYKVRRFNWFLYNNNDEFDFHMNDDLGKMVLNPDVVVRSRGVMEKCSFCIQGTQSVILKAKNEGREANANEFNDVVACSAACSTGALNFGDINNKESEVYKRKQDERVYHLLEYVGTKPNVFYHTKVRNIDKNKSI